MSVLTLTSDFGTKDPDLAVMKAQIMEAFPDLTIVDITHDITPFDMEEAYYILKNSLFAFPKGSIHFVALDTETFSKNRPVLVQDKDYILVGNDNGILPAILDEREYRAFYLDAVPFESFMKVHLEALIHLSQEAFPTLMTSPAEDLKKMKLPEPELGYEGNKVKYIRPKVLYIDHYGNAVFNLTKKEFEKWREGRRVEIKTHHLPITYMSQGYNDLRTSSFGTKRGGYGARFNSFDYLELFVNGSTRQTGGANTLLGFSKNDTVHIVFE
jgi:S-adenosylmethionine hydrolase